MMPVMLAGLGHHIAQRQALGLHFGPLRRQQAVFLGYDHAVVERQILDRVDKTHAGILHQEADGGAVRAAPKAMVELLGGADRKTGGFFVMEGTQTHVVCAALFELDVLAHHVDNINAGQQILNKTLRYHGK